MNDMDLDIVNSELQDVGKRLEKKWLADIDVGQGAKVLMTPDQRKKRSDILLKRKECIRNKKIKIGKYINTNDNTIDLEGLVDALGDITGDIEKDNLDQC